MRMVPAWAMKPVMAPASPAMARVPPLSEIPARSDASPSMKMRPPRALDPALCDALPRTRMVPPMRFSPTDQPDEAVDDDVGPGAVPAPHEPAEEVAGVALDGDGDVGRRRPTARLWRPRGLVHRAAAPSGSARRAG